MISETLKPYEVEFAVSCFPNAKPSDLRYKSLLITVEGEYTTRILKAEYHGVTITFRFLWQMMNDIYFLLDKQILYK